MTGLMKMTKNEKREIISKYLDGLFPNPKCELIYHNDYELLIAIVLSAQTTDKRVNMVTPILFSKYLRKTKCGQNRFIRRDIKTNRFF